MSGLASWCVFALATAAVCAPAAFGLSRGSRGGWSLARGALLGALVGPMLFVAMAIAAFLAGSPANVWSFVALAALHAGFWIVRSRRIGGGPSLVSPEGDPGPDAPSGRRPDLRFAHGTFENGERRLSPVASGLLLACACFAATLALAFVPVTRAFHDAHFHWLAKGLTLAVGGDADLLAWTHSPSYPLAIPVGHAFWLLLDSEVGVVAWQHALLAGILLYAAGNLTRRFGAPGAVVALVGLAPQWLATTWFGLGWGLYADATLAAALLLACVATAERLDGDARFGVLPAAIAWAFFAMTKANAAAYLVPLAGASIVAARRPETWEARSPRRRIARALAPFAGAIAALVAWHAWLAALGASDSTAGSAFRAFREDVLGSPAPGEALFGKLAASVRCAAGLLALDGPPGEALARSFWTIPAAALLALAARRTLSRGDRFLALAACGVALAVVAIYAAVPAADDAEADWWFRTGYSRSFAHVLPLSFHVVQIAILRLAAPALAVRAGRAAASPAAPSSGRLAFLVPGAFALAALAFPLRNLLSAPPRDERSRPGAYDYFEKLFPPERASADDPDRFGLRDPMLSAGHWIRWTAPTARLGVARRGDRLRVRYALARDDLSPANPVRVSIRVGDLPPRERVVEANGYFEETFDLPPESGARVEVEIRADPPWTAPNGQPTGVVLYEWEWPR